MTTQIIKFIWLGVQENSEEAIELSCFNGVINQICVDVVEVLVRNIPFSIAAQPSAKFVL